MPYVGSLPSVLNQTYRDSFTGNGSTTQFTLTRSVSGPGSILVVMGGTVQDESTYTVNDKTLTLTSTPASGINIDVIHLNNVITSGSGSGGGATGSGGNQVFYENETTVTASYSITAGKNAMSAGPVTINDGVTVTIPDGSRWTVV